MFSKLISLGVGCKNSISDDKCVELKQMPQGFCKEWDGDKKYNLGIREVCKKTCGLCAGMGNNIVLNVDLQNS